MRKLLFLILLLSSLTLQAQKFDFKVKSQVTHSVDLSVLTGRGSVLGLQHNSRARQTNSFHVRLLCNSSNELSFRAVRFATRAKNNHSDNSIWWTCNVQRISRFTSGDEGLLRRYDRLWHCISIF